MSISESQDPPGAVELREDAPLRAGAPGARFCSGGPRTIAAAFAVLTAAITVALLTQIHYGDYEVVPHGSVSSSAAACSRAGAAALRAGGGAVDAAVATALCLTVLAPHRTSLDASGALVYWEYRSSRTQPPTAVEWGGVAEVEGQLDGGALARPRPPRLLAALAALHAQLGALPWAAAVQPAIDLAREGYVVSESLSAAAAARGVVGFTAATLRTEPALADYLETLVHNTSSELCSSWSCDVRRRSLSSVPAGAWHVWSAGAGAGAAAALSDALALDLPQLTPTTVFERVVKSLQQQVQAATAAKQQLPSGVASGLAVVDPHDTYLALVTGLSTPFGSGPSAGGAWSRDEPSAPLDLAPAIITDQHVCGTRYIMGAESTSALAEGAAGALAGGGGADAVAAVEAARALLRPDGSLAAEPGRPAPALAGLPPLPPLSPLSPAAALPQPALNFVQQRGDTLLSHADSRGGGLASRF